MNNTIYNSFKGSRKTNEDAYLINHEERVYGIADGIGGKNHGIGNIASSVTLKIIEQEVSGIKDMINDLSEEIISKILTDITKDTNEFIYYGGKSSFGNQCGTTLDYFFIHDNTIYGNHVGDSIVAILNPKENFIETLSPNYDIKKKSVQEHIKELAFTPLKEYIGKDPKLFNSHSYIREIQPGEYVLLATDGVIKNVSLENILEIITENNYLQLIKKEIDKRIQEPTMQRKLAIELVAKKNNFSSKEFIGDNATYILMQRD